MATEVFEGGSVIVPEELEDRVDVVELEEGVSEIAVTQQVSGLELSSETGSTTAIAGRKVSESTVKAKAEKEDTTSIVFQTTKVDGSDITVRGKGAGDVKVNTGRFNNSSITFKKKSNDSVEFNNGVEVRNVSIDGGKRADTITFRENAAIKGVNEITLGKGADLLELPEDNSANGSIVVKDLKKGDTIKVGDTEYSGRDILNGEVDLPSYITIEGMD